MMREDPSESVFRYWSQTAYRCCRQKRWYWAC